MDTEELLSNELQNDERKENELQNAPEHRSFAEFAKDKLDSAGRELRRRLPLGSGLGAHLMHPRRLLLRSTPTRHCDVVLTFPKGAPDSALLWLLQKLRNARPRLRVCVRQHTSTQCSAFYVTADDEVLLQTAEEIHLPKLLKPEFGGGYKEFTVRDMHCFQKSHNATELLSTSERAALVRYALEAARAELGDEKALEPALTLRPGQSIVPACVSHGVLAAMFPLHERKSLDRLRQKWVKSVLSPQPLDEISDYFGVKIAMYFAWLGHYTCALTVPAAVGFVFWIWIGTANETWRDIAQVLFSIFNVLWACLYLETWKRYSNELAYKWGTLDQRDDLLVEPRPLFQGEMQTSAVTGRPEPQYPAWRRRLWRHLVSGPAIAACLALAACATFALLRAQDWWETRIGYFSWIPRAVLAILISVEEEIYARIARWLNDKENYRLEKKYENHLIVKIALFQFMNSFMSLFYIAFYLQDTEKLKEQLAVLLITRQIIGTVKESALPYLIEHMRLAKICFDVFGALSPSKVPTATEISESFSDAQADDETSSRRESMTRQDSSDRDRDSRKEKDSDDEGRRDSDVTVGQKIINQAELESQLFQYDGTFGEYLEMLTQLGHVVLFSAAFPLAAMCALINNAIEIRADAFKLCHVSRRPFAQRVASIGSWQHAMEAMVVLAVLVNCAQIGLSGLVHRLMPTATPAQTILLIVTLEHVVLILALALRLVVPALPSWLATEMAKVEYQRREAIKNAQAPLLSTHSDESQENLLTKQFGRLTPGNGMSPGSPPKGKLSPKHLEKRPLVADIGKISLIPPFRSKPTSSASVSPSAGVTAGFPDVSPTANLKDSQLSVAATLVGANLGLRSSEPLYRSAHCLPHATHATHASPLSVATHHKEQIGSPVGSGSEPKLSTAASTLTLPGPEASTSSEEDKPKERRMRPSTAALVKRARSVAVFSLRLRRAREAAAANAADAEKPAAMPPPMYGGELSLIPIEKLIQVEDAKPRAS